MSKHIFEVRIILKDGTRNDYVVTGDDDREARKKAVDMETKQYHNDFPGVDYCEIEHYSLLDG